MEDDLWKWEVILYGSVFCNGERSTKEDAMRAAVKYADENLSENTRLDAHFEVRKWNA